MAEEIVNLFETTLAANITSGATTMTLTATTGPGGAIGTGGTWRFVLGRDTATPEIVTGTSRTGSVVTMTRAQGGTSAKAWSAGTKVTLAITEEAILAVIGDNAYHAGGTDVAVADGGTGASSASAARTNLGLVIGTDVQAFSAEFAKRTFELKIFDDATTVTTGDGKLIFCIPATVGGADLTAAHAFVSTNSSSGTPTVQIRNVTQAADMLTTRITIDANEPTSYTAATPPVIDTGNDDVATGDLIAVDVDVAGTGAKGLGVILTFTLP